MQKYTLTLPLLFLFAMTMLLSACAGKTMVESDLGMSGAPDWVNEGTQYLNNKDGRLFHGVGQAPALGDDSLQLSSADNRARAEVARILSSFMDVVSNDYSSAAASEGRQVSQQNVSREISNFTKVNLTGVRIIGRWKNEKDGTVFSIAELDMKQMQSTLSAVNDMNSDLKRYLSSEGPNIFDKMTQEKP